MSTKTRKPKIGLINMQRPDMGVRKKWKAYNFHVTAMYFLYFKTENTHKADGQILLNSITKLETDSARDASYPLQVHFRGKAERGAGSPWVLDLTSNEERIEWMEALKPGSSEYLQKFSKQNSLHRTMPATFQDNPYSLAGQDPSVGSETLTHKMPELSSPFQSSGNHQTQPSNYMEPIPSSRGWKDTDHYSQTPAAGVQSECVRGNPHVKPQANLSSSADSRPPQQSGGHINSTRQQHNRATIAHSERDHSPMQLSRSLTERTMGPEHHYELDSMGLAQQIKPPLPDRPPPAAKPRNKRPPPRLRNVSDSLSDSQSVSSPGEVLSPEEVEPRYSCGPRARTSKEAEYHLPTQPEPAPRKLSKPTASPSPKAVTKPPITPRKMVTNLANKSPNQSDYLRLLSDDESGQNGVSTSTDSAGYDDIPQSPPSTNVSSLPEDVVQNFTPHQLDMLISMLQQVQSGGHQPEAKPPTPNPRSEGSSVSVENGHMKKQFERAISHTPQLQTEKILVIDEEDEEGYETRPDWAKAVSSRRTMNPDTDVDGLSDLHQEALYISRSRLANFTEIGEGQFGKVFRATMQRGSEPIKVAVKTAKKSTSEEFLQEMKIMSQMVHPNIVQLYGIIRDDVPAPWIVLEYLHHGDIKNFLIKNKRSVERLVKYMIDVSMGMHYLSEKGLVHRDLAARNVLVGENETCKVSDFGLLRELPKDESIYCMQTNVPCPVRWMAPESIEERKFSFASDVWSFGVLQWEMFYPHKTPYENLGNIEVAMRVIKGHRLAVPAACPDVVSRIMKACWHQKPEKRPSFLLISTLLTTKVSFPNE